MQSKKNYEGNIKTKETEKRREMHVVKWVFKNFRTFSPQPPSPSSRKIWEFGFCNYMRFLIQVPAGHKDPTKYL